MICTLCKLLHNPFKRELLRRIYASHGGANVGIIAEEMKRQGLVPSGVSQYLKQLEGLGVIRRERSGRFVNYVPDPRSASPDVREIVERFTSDNGLREKQTLNLLFGALMNPFRAKVIALLAQAGEISALDICSKTHHQPRLLRRDLQAAVDAGLIRADDSETPLAVYHFVRPTDPLTQALVSFC